MPDEARLIGAFTLALLASFMATPVAIALATRTGFHDRPLGYKAHGGATPYLGGTAVLGGFLLGAVGVGDEAGRLAPIMVCAFALWVLGTLDDRVNLSPTLRILAEAAAATFLWALDLGWSVFGSEALNLVVTAVWTIGLVNAFNLMDNADGAAAAVGSVTALAVGALALIQGDTALAALCAGLAGACLGFLPYNLSAPARIFLGDGGSLPIGVAIAGAIMALPQDGQGDWALLLAGLLLAGLPVLDTALVVVSRRRRGRPVLRGGRDHLAHRLTGRLPSPRAVAALLGGGQAALALVAIGVIQLGKGSIIAAWCLWFVAAAAAVAYLETRLGAPEEPAAVPAGAARRRQWAARSPTMFESGMVVLIGVLSGLSPVVSGFYELSVWGPITLVLLAVLVGLLIARPAVPRRSALIALAGLTGLWLWSQLSTGWGESADRALTEGNRWLLYAALLAVLVILLRNDSLGRLLLSTLTATILAVAVAVAGVMLVGDGQSLFLEGRLHEPLGFINGQAAFFLLGFWPLVAVAEQWRRPLVAAAAVSGATLLGALTVLSQTRAIVPALALSVLVIVAFVPGRLPRVLALIAVAAGLAAALPALLEVYDASGSGERPPSADSVREAGAAMLIGAGLAGAVFGLGSWASGALGERARPRLARATAWAIGGVVAVAMVGGLTVANPVDTARDQVDAFVNLESDNGDGTRLGSGGGNRYDFWRVAVEQFRDHPLRGVGAGNYESTYYLERRTDENVTQPHSLELQVLAELGIVGVLLLALLLVGIVLGFAARARSIRAADTKPAVTVAAGGMFVVWLLQTSVDWLHVIPGVTGIALCAGAVLVSSWAWERDPGRGRLRRVVIGIGVVIVLFGAFTVGRATLAEHYRSNARDDLESDPVAALRSVDDALALNDESLPAYYVRSAAYARLDRYREARAALREAARREPSDFVPWALLGDLAVRRGDLAQARRDYTRASRLNPREGSLRRLARDPTAPPES